MDYMKLAQVSGPKNRTTEKRNFSATLEVLNSIRSICALNDANCMKNIVPMDYTIAAD